MNGYDVILIGGGLAGLTAAIHLAQNGRAVCLIEKAKYPHHKVCGEYVSNEVVPYLQSLGVSLSENSVVIDSLQLSTVTGQHLELNLPLGGFGISRYAFDHLLFQRARQLGVEFVFEAATSITFHENSFECIAATGKKYQAEIVIGAFGKRSQLDKKLKRDFMNRKSSWLGVKCHYEYSDLPNNRVALHNFQGGYGGLSRTETGAVNFCYLASYESFKRYKNIDCFNTGVVRQNPFLDRFLAEAKPVFDAPLSIAQISFEEKKPIENHIIMCGDAAGLIHPLCGNGMAMAIHSAKIASERILQYFDEESYDRARLEFDYETAWKAAFTKRLSTGRRLQAVLLNESISKIAMATVAKSSWLLKKLIAQTHGKPLIC